MGLFSRKNNKDLKDSKKTIAKESVDKKEQQKTDSKNTVNNSPEGSKDLSRVIIRPRVSEKGAVVAEISNAYIFDVNPNSTKEEISAAIYQIYKVKPIKISTAKVPAKKVRVRGQRRKTGVKSSGKKAFVYLKKGEKIEFI